LTKSAETTLQRRFMQKFIGKMEDFIAEGSIEDKVFWADHQVLGPMFAALRVFMSMNDVLVIIVGAKGCAYHLNFTMVAWGELDFFLGKRPLPVLEFTQLQIINGNYAIPDLWLKSLINLVTKSKYNRIILMPTDSILISGGELTTVALEIARATGIETTPLTISAISSANQWAGYNAALHTLYEPYMERQFTKTPTVNLVGWMWPSRHRGHEIGCCLDMLGELGIEVNTVISGGIDIADIEKSMTASANAVVCSAIMGDMLDQLDRKGVALAGSRAPYGFSGTREWLSSIAKALGKNVNRRIDYMEQRYYSAFSLNKKELKHKKVFVSGGPGRLVGLLHALNDYEMDIQVAAMFWPHEWSKSDIRHMLEQHHVKTDLFILSPGLDDLEWVAANYDIDVWLGGYQDQHVCKRHHIPFVPITVYQVPHVGFEGIINLGNKLIMALNGHSFVDNAYIANDIGGYICQPVH